MCRNYLRGMPNDGISNGSAVVMKILGEEVSTVEYIWLGVGCMICAGIIGCVVYVAVFCELGGVL